MSPAQARIQRADLVARNIAQHRQHSAPFGRALDGDGEVDIDVAKDTRTTLDPVIKERITREILQARSADHLRICAVCDELRTGGKDIKAIAVRDLAKEHGILLERMKALLADCKQPVTGPLRQAYTVHVHKLRGILLSPRGVDRHNDDTATLWICSQCERQLLTGVRPEFAIANGFAIGAPVGSTTFTCRDEAGREYEHALSNVTWVEWSTVKRVRPSFNLVTAPGGPQKAITGNVMTAFHNVEGVATLLPRMADNIKGE